MKALNSRTSLTIDEAVANLLGWYEGPVEFFSDDANLSPEQQEELDALDYSLWEQMSEERDVLESAYYEARSDNLSDGVVAERLEALREYDDVIAKAKVYECDIVDELSKGSSSMLRLARDQSNLRHITMTSLHDWAVKEYGIPLFGRPTITEDAPTVNGMVATVDAQISKPLPKLRAQERHILEAIRNLGYDPEQLPRIVPGKPGIKANVWDAVRANPLFHSRNVFDAAWERLRDGKEIVNVS